MPPIRNDDWAAPGLSTITTVVAFGLLGVPRWAAPRPSARAHRRRAPVLGARCRPDGRRRRRAASRCSAGRTSVEALHFVARDGRDRALRSPRAGVHRDCCSPKTAAAKARSAIAGPRSRSLLQRREAHLPHALQVRRREAGMQRDVGEQRERAVQLRGGRVQRDGALLPAARRAELDAEIRLPGRRSAATCAIVVPSVSIAATSAAVPILPAGSLSPPDRT